MTRHDPPTADDRPHVIERSGRTATVVRWLGLAVFLVLFLNVARGLGGAYSGVWWTYGAFFVLVGGGIWWEAARWRRVVRQRARRRHERGIRATEPPPSRRRSRLPRLRHASRRSQIEGRKPSTGMLWAQIGMWAMLALMLVLCGLMLLKLTRTDSDWLRPQSLHQQDGGPAVRCLSRPPHLTLARRACFTRVCFVRARSGWARSGWAATTGTDARPG